MCGPGFLLKVREKRSYPGNGKEFEYHNIIIQV
jgi:hypothetical protein